MKFNLTAEMIKKYSYRQNFDIYLYRITKKNHLASLTLWNLLELKRSKKSEMSGCRARNLRSGWGRILQTPRECFAAIVCKSSITAKISGLRAHAATKKLWRAVCKKNLKKNLLKRQQKPLTRRERFAYLLLSIA